MWAALIAGLLGGAGGILGSILQNNRAKDILQEGERYKQYGMQGMESLLAERQQAYNNVWKMIYGGVSNFDFSSISPPTWAPGDTRSDREDNKTYGPRPGTEYGGSRSGGYTRYGYEDWEKPESTGPHGRDRSLTVGKRKFSTSDDEDKRNTNVRVRR